LQDKSFKDMLIDIIYDNIILLLQHQSHHIAFPELVLPLIIRMKEFIKKCKNGNYVKVMKGLLEKIQENSKYIEDSRDKVKFTLKDNKEVDLWIEENKIKGTPLSTWYSRYKTMRERELLMESTQSSKVTTKEKAPTIERPSREQDELSKVEDRKEFADLFADLSENDSDSGLDFIPKKKKSRANDNAEEDDANEENDDDDDFADKRE